MEQANEDKENIANTIINKLAILMSTVPHRCDDYFIPSISFGLIHTFVLHIPLERTQTQQNYIPV